MDLDDLDYSPTPKEAVFETLAEGSTSLIVQPGTRLMLNLEELLKGGDKSKKTWEKGGSKMGSKTSGIHKQVQEGIYRQGCEHFYG
eukprot:14722394-Ditylum_brightwellii.AAC.1